MPESEVTHRIDTYQTAFGWGWGCSCGATGTGHFARSAASAYAYGSRHVVTALRKEKESQ